MATRENFSRKRIAIYDTLKNTKVHPTAEWVYNELKPIYPDLSLGTVYRNIKKFCDDKVTKSVGVINGQEHFDGDTSPHSHFVCEKCGVILDIFEPLLVSDLENKLTKEFKFQLTDQDILFKGFCENCKESH